VDPGTYTVTELSATGWMLTGISCDHDGALTDLGDRSATVTLGSGEGAPCTFTNEPTPPRMGTLVIEKVTDPIDATETFAFETTVPEWAPVLGNGDSAEMMVPPGKYTITEPMTAGWYLSDLTCDDPDAALDLQGTAVVNVPEGETVTCTFTNTQQGTLWVGKSTLEYDDSVYFEFTSDVAGWPPDLHGGMAASTTVEPGTYTVSELAKDGWELTDISCDAPDAVVDLEAASATVHVGAGEFVKCTFTNAAVEEVLGAIGDYVWHDKDRDGVQEVGEPGIEGVRVNVYVAGNPTPPIVLLATATTDADGYYLIENVPAGSYIVEFTNLPKGYHWTKPFATSDRTLDSDAGIETGRSPVMVVPAGFVDLTCDAGAYTVAFQVLPLTGSDLDRGLVAGLAMLLVGASLVLAVKPRRIVTR
jgi:hypothetical protein